ncbi:MAG: response regulator [Cyanobacteria bacterium J083]|nr:MAG: response regulator [Cyanobacteria bacterium J083]
MRYFSLTSLFAFIITIASLANFYHRQAFKYLLTLEESKNVSLANSFVNFLWREYAPLLTKRQSLSREQLQAHPEILRLNQIIREQMADLDVVKVKIYNLQGKTVFSTDLKQIGEDKSDAAGFLVAQSGKIITQLDHRDTFNGMVGQIKHRQLISSYLPIKHHNSREIEGVFELYRDVTPLVKQIARTKSEIILASSLILAALYLILWQIVRWGDRLIIRQNLALTESRHKQEIAEIANRAKSQFLANMSHELRTPLNAILGFTQLLERDPLLTSQQRENLDIINRSGEHLLALINDVLNLAKIESGQMDLNSSSFDFYRLLDSIEELFTLKLKTKNLKLIKEFSPALPQYIKTDEQKLRQILLNVLSNAIKFTERGKIALRIACSQESEGIRINCQVEDTGCGIAAAKITAVFKPFVQINNSSTQVHPGTGLGLPISRKFAQLMGGDMKIESILGQGTKVDFNFLAQPTNQINTEKVICQHKVIGLKPDQPKYRILVADDRWENRQILVKLLTSVGFIVKEAENGQEAVSICLNWQPNLIFMDMRMPVLDGYQATQKIRSHLPGQATAIIALTATAFDEQKSIILGAGCDDLIRKPFREEIIWQKIARYLGVSYIYEETSPPAKLSTQLANSSDNSQSNFKLEATALEVMPREWINELEKATLRLEEELVCQLLHEIPPEHHLLAKALQDKLKNFDFGAILELIRQVNKC